MSIPSETDAPRSVSRGNLKRTIGSILGVCLFIAAVAFAVRKGGDPAQLIEHVRTAPAWLIALAILLPALNWLFISLSFLVPMRRHARITAAEMLAVIGAAWLLNYFPLRPGLFGRLAYHKTVNRVAVRDSIAVTFIGMGCGAASVLITLGIAASLPADSPVVRWTLSLAAAPLIAAAAAIALRSRGLAWLPLTFLFRYADLLVWIARYWVVFRIAGQPIGLPASTAFAAVCQASITIPFVGNGLGIREWAIALTATHLPASAIQAGMTLPRAVVAEILNRAAEICVAIPVGLSGVVWLARRNRQ